MNIHRKLIVVKIKKLFQNIAYVLILKNLFQGICLGKVYDKNSGTTGEIVFSFVHNRHSRGVFYLCPMTKRTIGKKCQGKYY